MPRIKKLLYSGRELDIYSYGSERSRPNCTSGFNGLHLTTFSDVVTPTIIIQYYNHIRSEDDL